MQSTIVGWETIRHDIQRMLTEQKEHNLTDLVQKVAANLNVEEQRVLRILIFMIGEGEIQATVFF